MESFSELITRHITATTVVPIELESECIDNCSVAGAALDWAMSFFDDPALFTPCHHWQRLGSATSSDPLLHFIERAGKALAILLLTCPEYHSYVAGLRTYVVGIPQYPVETLQEYVTVGLFPSDSVYQRFRYIAHHVVDAFYYTQEPESPHDIAEHLRVSLNLILVATKHDRNLREVWLAEHSDWILLLNDSEVDHYTA